MPTQLFFDEPRLQSLVKTAIVTKYFAAWAKVMLSVRSRSPRGRKRVAYIDLFAGPGRYQDGTPSTPLVVLEKAIADPSLCSTLVTIFNDAKPSYARSLREEIALLPGAGSLTYQPKVLNIEVGEQLASHLSELSLVPTLLFADPWGYKGLSLELLGGVLKNWGCDCIFFFNYRRVNMALENPYFQGHMNAVFGPTRAQSLRQQVASRSPAERECIILDQLCQALSEVGGKYVLPFCFTNDAGTRTSHHLVFASKNPLGYKVMKDIMAAESSRKEQNVARFGYCPADSRFPVLFELNRPLDGLAALLLDTFAGQSLTVEEVFRRHNTGTPFVLRNYREILKRLEETGQITCTPASTSRRKGTMAPRVMVHFPPK